MSMSLGNPDQPPSPWQEHIDVLRNINDEDRDPQSMAVQKLWVFLEQHKREKAEGNVEVADEVLRNAKRITTAWWRRVPIFRLISARVSAI